MRCLVFPQSPFLCSPLFHTISVSFIFSLKFFLILNISSNFPAWPPSIFSLFHTVVTDFQFSPINIISLIFLTILLFSQYFQIISIYSLLFSRLYWLCYFWTLPCTFYPNSIQPNHPTSPNISILNSITFIFLSSSLFNTQHSDPYIFTDSTPVLYFFSFTLTFIFFYHTLLPSLLASHLIPFSMTASFSRTTDPCFFTIYLKTKFFYSNSVARYLNCFVYYKWNAYYRG